MLAYHQALGALGIGDLHPGGAHASELLVRWLRERRPREVLEVGAGVGKTALRLAAEGFAVTALEPDPVLFRKLGQLAGVRALAERVEEHCGAYDAMLGESVIYMLVPEKLPALRALLRPGGVLAFVEMVWTERADPDEARRLHDRTLHEFGIALATRERYTWADWRSMLESAGFEVARAVPLGPGSPERATAGTWRDALGGLARHPRVLVDVLRMRRAERRFSAPPGWLESWACLAVSLP